MSNEQGTTSRFLQYKLTQTVDVVVDLVGSNRRGDVGRRRRVTKSCADESCNCVQAKWFESECEVDSGEFRYEFRFYDVVRVDFVVPPCAKKEHRIRHLASQRILIIGDS